MPSAQPRPPRDWRTREDPLGEVWDTEVVPLLQLDQKGVLQAKTILEVLCERYPDRFQEKYLRTVQRRVRDWRAEHGPDKEVFFEQVLVAGREAQFDFTDASDLGVTIGGSPLAHKFFEFILSFSKWRWASLAFGETYEAMASGLQGAVWALGGTPAIWRSDNLSAATHQLREEAGRELTEKYRALLGHYAVASTRINIRKSHENGVVEKGHDVLKTAVEQALIVRQSSDFATLDDYRAFLGEIVAMDSLGIKACGRLSPGGFIVPEGSAARASESNTLRDAGRNLRESLVQQAVLKMDGDRYVMTQDYEFTSPSTAATVVLGAEKNGREYWKLPDGRTLKDWQTAELSD